MPPTMQWLTACCTQWKGATLHHNTNPHCWDNSLAWMVSGRIHHQSYASPCWAQRLAHTVWLWYERTHSTPPTSPWWALALQMPALIFMFIVHLKRLG
jgi:hypothetical protein